MLKPDNLPDWFVIDQVITLAQQLYDKQRKSCSLIENDVYGLGVRANHKFMFLYFKVHRRKVISCTMMINDGRLDGLEKLSLAYAVIPKYQGKGHAKTTTATAIKHLKLAINIKDVSRYYLVSYVATDNFVSQHITEHFFGTTRKEVIDDHTGEKQFEYRMLIEK